jgi:hypothetical protein
MRVGAEIAHAGVDVQLTVRRDAQQSIETVRAGRVVALANPDAGHLSAVPLSGALFPLIPVEEARAFVQRLLDEGAGERPAVGADLAR